MGARFRVPPASCGFSGKTEGLQLAFFPGISGLGLSMLIPGEAGQQAGVIRRMETGAIVPREADDWSG